MTAKFQYQLSINDLTSINKHSEDPEIDIRVNISDIFKENIPATMAAIETQENDITEDEVENSIKRLNANKVGGDDNIEAIIIKTLKDELTPILTKIYNKMFKYS